MIDWYDDLFLGKCRQMFYWTPSHGWKVCLGLLGSVCPSVCLSVHPSVHLSSILLFALLSLQKCNYLGIYKLVFCDIWHGIRAPYGIVCGIFTEKCFGQKWPKNGQKSPQKWEFWTIFKNSVINFCLKY